MWSNRSGHYMKTFPNTIQLSKSEPSKLDGCLETRYMDIERQIKRAEKIARPNG